LQGKKLFFNKSIGLLFVFFGLKTCGLQCMIINLLEPCKEKNSFLIKALVFFFVFLGLKYVASNASAAKIIMEVYVHFFHI